VPVLPPDINESQLRFTVTPNGVRFGLTAIKNVGEGAIESLLAVRQKHGRIKSLSALCEDLDLRLVNKRVFESLIKAGAFDSLGAKRSQLMAMLDQAIDDGAAAQREREMGQTSIFGGDMAASGSASGHVEPTLPNLPEWDQAQRLKYERELTGFYITAHPLARYEATIHALATATTAGITELSDGKEVRLCGIIATVKAMLTKKGDRMAYVTLEDLQGTVEVIVFPDLFKTVGDLIAPEQVIRVTGTIDRGDKGTKIRGVKIEPLAEVQTQTIKRIHIRLAARPEVKEQLPRLLDVFKRHPGGTAVSLTFRTDGALEAETAPLPHLTVSATEHFVADVEEVLGKGALSLVS
jgi:DNA polymerase III subunit alpha